MEHIHVRIKPQYLIVRIISTFIYSVCFIFIKRFFLVRPRRKLAMLLTIRATFRPYRADVTANSNTPDVFQYKTNNNKARGGYSHIWAI